MDVEFTMDPTIVANKAFHVFFAIALNEDLEESLDNESVLSAIGAKCLGTDIIDYKVLKTL